MTPTWTPSAAALRRFLAVQSALADGGPPELGAFLARPAVPAAEPGAAPGPEALRRLGRAELGGLAAWLGRARRAALDERLRRVAGLRLPRGARRLPGWALPSLRACLLEPGPGGGGWLERAGLHRVARALADRPPPLDRGWPAGLSAPERDLLRAAHAWLASQPGARREAAHLRRTCGLPG